jgi:hypothetical protein
MPGALIGGSAELGRKVQVGQGAIIKQGSCDDSSLGSTSR